MPSTLDADTIIAEENLSDTNLATEEETPNNGAEEEPNNQDEAGASDDGGASEEPSDQESGDEQHPTPPTEEIQDDSNVVTPKPSPSNIAPVKFDESKMFDEQGNVRPFNEVVNVGEYLASQIKPVSVVGEDGKTYTFHTIKDVEEQFPDGFKAKNNMEKLRFESAIVANDNKFNEAVDKLRGAEQEYQEYTSSAIETRQSQANIAAEYRAMADQGLVPKVGDPYLTDANGNVVRDTSGKPVADPKFGESDAVKELNNIMAWMDKTNAENAQKGLGKINSLYIAKQLMDMEGAKSEKEDKGKQIIQERNDVASLSSSPIPDTGKKAPAPDIPLSRLADEIIASEGLR